MPGLFAARKFRNWISEGATKSVYWTGEELKWMLFCKASLEVEITANVSVGTYCSFSIFYYRIKLSLKGHPHTDN